MSGFICQNEVNVANEPLEVEQPLLESSSGTDKLVYDLYQILLRHQNYRDWDNISFSLLSSDGEFLLTDLRSTKILDKVVKEVQKCSILVA